MKKQRVVIRDKSSEKYVFDYSSNLINNPDEALDFETIKEAEKWIKLISANWAIIDVI